jgi:membrane-bound ClpP family serine protease
MCANDETTGYRLKEVAEDVLFHVFEVLCEFVAMALLVLIGAAAIIFFTSSVAAGWKVAVLFVIVLAISCDDGMYYSGTLPPQDRKKTS